MLIGSTSEEPFTTFSVPGFTFRRKSSTTTVSCEVWVRLPEVAVTLRVKLPAAVDLTVSLVMFVPLLESLSVLLRSDADSPVGSFEGRLSVTVPLKFPMLEIVMLDLPEAVTLKMRFGEVGVSVKSGTGTISWTATEFCGSGELVPVMLSV